MSSNCWDAIGATWFGYTTLWVNRAGAPIEQLDTEPTRTGSSLRAVLDFFPSAAVDVRAQGRDIGGDPNPEAGADRQA